MSFNTGNPIGSRQMVFINTGNSIGSRQMVFGNTGNHIGSRQNIVNEYNVDSIVFRYLGMRYLGIVDFCNMMLEYYDFRYLGIRYLGMDCFLKCGWIL